ncbi:hypothetical protein ACF05T_20845 [Streptomyces lateritius]|uniref:Chaplin domain-containing protein n=1 Tax=Streptomyces lateritius TaxID=67313 RepID=A0ABW6YFW6_9ACTN
MLGAGVASADNAYGSGNGADPALCHQEIHQGTVQNGLVNIADLGLGLLGNGSGPARANQQICANGPVFAENEADSGSNESLFLLGLL